MAQLPLLSALTDPELIERYRQDGDNRYVGELYSRYVHLVFGVCRKYLKHDENARDAANEVFEQLLAKLKSHEISYFKSWLYSVAKNHCLMKLRKKLNHMELDEGLEEFVETGQSLHPEEGNLEEKLQDLELGIIKLNEEQRLCIDLFYLQQKSYQEIMLQTGFTFKQVKSFIQNGRRNLRNEMTRTQ